MKIVSIVGARPQFIKVKPLTEAFRNCRSIKHILVHTGQHYDYNMSEVFFRDLRIPRPKYHLGVGSGTHGFQTGEMLKCCEKVLAEERPDWVIVYGDTNSTLAGALAAAKLDIRVAHVEAGLRSYRKDMPEEINRVLTDHLSTLLFCPTRDAVSNLRKEGLVKGVYEVGDVMYDIFLKIKAMAKKSRILDRLGLKPGEYLLLTIHRKENTDNAGNLAVILSTLIKTREKVVFPVHPRTAAVLKKLKGLALGPWTMIDPVSYLDMFVLESNAKKVVTDSGGVQKEAFWLRVPCVTLREETEWNETLANGWNRLAGAKDPGKIYKAVMDTRAPGRHPDFFGNGLSAAKILSVLKTFKE